MPVKTNATLIEIHFQIAESRFHVHSVARKLTTFVLISAGDIMINARAVLYHVLLPIPFDSMENKI